jgi:hypothetical protein
MSLRAKLIKNRSQAPNPEKHLKSVTSHKQIEKPGMIEVSHKPVLSQHSSRGPEAPSLSSALSK